MSVLHDDPVLVLFLVAGTGYLIGLVLKIVLAQALVAGLWA